MVFFCRAGCVPVIMAGSFRLARESPSRAACALTCVKARTRRRLPGIKAPRPVRRHTTPMTAFLFAIWALLLTPGPSNSLVALSGMRSGVARSLRLLPAELAAYLLTVVPLALVGQRLLAAWPAAAVALKLIAALWVLRLAVKNWSLADPARATTAVTFRELFVTTLLNPKALIFGCVLLPQPAVFAQFPLAIALFAGSVLATALLWMTGGALVGARSMPGDGAKYLHRAVAAWLALLSVGLAGSALS